MNLSPIIAQFLDYIPYFWVCRHCLSVQWRSPITRYWSQFYLHMHTRWCSMLNYTLHIIILQFRMQATKQETISLKFLIRRKLFISSFKLTVNGHRHSSTCARITYVNLPSQVGNEYIYVCIYIYIYVCVCVCVCVCVWSNISVYKRA